MKKYLKLIFSFFAMVALVTATSCDDDELTAGPTVLITSVNPGAEYPLESVSIEGENFDTVYFVFLGNVEVEFQLEGNTITFIIPDRTDAGITPITLAMANNYRVSTEMEVLLRPTPRIDTVSPSAAEPGENVTITGSNLDNLIEVSISDFEGTVVSSSATELIFTVPEGPQNNTLATIEIETTGGSAASESIFYVGKNLVMNGALEEGTGDEFTSWGQWNGGDGMGASDQPYAGRSLKAIAAGGDAWRTQFASDPTETEVGVDYIAFMWVKAEETGGNIRFSTNSTAGAIYSDNYDIGTEWQQIEWTFTNNDPASILVLDLGVSDGMVYHVDNITLVSTLSGPPPPPNLLLNGDLELGGADDFTNWGQWNGPDGMTVETTEVHGGNRALRAAPSGGAAGDAWRTQFASDPVTLEVGKSYLASMWIKGEGAGDGGNVRMSTQPEALYGPDYIITGEWVEVTWEFVANVVETNLVLDLGAVDGAIYYIDDLSLTEIPIPPPTPINLNGSFEDAVLGEAVDVSGWAGLTGDLASGEITDEESHDGDQSLKMTINALGDNAWNIQPNSSMQVVDGETYHLSVWFKGTGIANMKVAIDQGGTPGWDEWGNPEVGFTDGEWTEVSYDFTAATTNPADGNARFAISMSYDGNVGGVIYIDDLEVIIVE